MHSTMLTQSLFPCWIVNASLSFLEMTTLTLSEMPFMNPFSSILYQSHWGMPYSNVVAVNKENQACKISGSLACLLAWSRLRLRNVFRSGCLLRKWLYQPCPKGTVSPLEHRMSWANLSVALMVMGQPQPYIRLMVRTRDSSSAGVRRWKGWWACLTV